MRMNIQLQLKSAEYRANVR